MKNNLWNNLETGKKILYLILSTLNTLTANLINNVEAIILMPMALTAIYKHYEGFDRSIKGLKYVGSIVVSMIINTVTLGAVSWYVLFGDIFNVDAFLRDGQNMTYVIADEANFED